MHGNPRLKTGHQRLRSPTKRTTKASPARKLKRSVGGSKQWGLKTMAKSDATHNAPRLHKTILPPH